MERLTHPRSSGIKTGHWSPNKKDELVERLAAYENTGLTPEEVVKVNDFEKSQTGHLLKKTRSGTEEASVDTCDGETAGNE